MLQRCNRYQHPEEFGGIPVAPPEYWALQDVTPRRPEASPEGFNRIILSEYCSICDVSHGVRFLEETG